MAIDYNGETFTPKTAQENALEILAYINALLVTNNVKDTSGEQAVIYVSAANIIWLFILAVGTALTAFQWLVQATGNSLSIENCSDQQILNLAQIAGTEREAGTKTIVFVSVTAGAGGACTVTPSNLIRYTDEVSFEPITTTVIPTGTTVQIETMATVAGQYIILAGELSQFITAPANFSSLTNISSSLPGQPVETYNELRARLQLGNSLNSSLDNAILAIRNLDDVQYCNIFFNPSTTLNLTLPGGIVIAPRKCRIFLYGVSSLFAETYFSYMTAETEGTLHQDYITLSNQALPVNYDLATLRNIYVKVVVTADSGQDGYETEIKRVMVSASNSKPIGVDYSQQYLLNYFDTFSYAEVIALYVSMDGVTWTDLTTLDGDELGVIAAVNVSIEEK